MMLFTLSSKAGRCIKYAVAVLFLPALLVGCGSSAPTQPSHTQQAPASQAAMTVLTGDALYAENEQFIAGLVAHPVANPRQGMVTSDFAEKSVELLPMTATREVCDVVPGLTLKEVNKVDTPYAAEDILVQVIAQSADLDSTSVCQDGSLFWLPGFQFGQLVAQ